MGMEFLYSFNLETKTPVMLINQHIGFDEIEGQGIDGNQFLIELMELDKMNYDEIKVYINSGGGSITDGMSIFRAILDCKTAVNTYCIGLAASIAAVIFQAGNKRYISDFGLVMVHNPINGDDKSLASFKECLLVMMGRTGIDEKKLSKLMTDETWINGNDESNKGIWFDEIIITEKKDLKKYKVKKNVEDFYLLHQKAVNSAFIKINEIEMDNVKTLLGLEKKANEADVINSIQNFISDKVEMDKKITKMEEDKKALMDEISDLKAKMKNEDDEDKFKSLSEDVKSCKMELDTLKEKITERKAKNEEEVIENKIETPTSIIVEKPKNEFNEKQIKNILEAAILKGKILNTTEVKNFWCESLKNDFETSLTQLQDMPVNVVSPKNFKEEERTYPTTAWGLAAKIRNRKKNNSK